MLGVDASARIPSAALKDLRSWGVRFVGRYLQTLVAPEVDDIAAAGLYLLSIFEANPTHVSYFTQSQGARDGAKAKLRALAAGQPEGSVVHATVDMDLRGASLKVLDAYLPAFADALAPFKAGLYGSNAVLQYASGPKVVSRWQTMAWSGGEINAQADIYQWAGGAMLFGQDVDIDWARTTTGLWIPPGMQVPKPATI